MIRRHTVSFKHAGEGIWYNLRTQPNFRTHIVAALLVLGIGWFLRITRWEWLLLLFTITLVIGAEMMNTALESVTDLLTEKYHLKAKIVKDTAAGMVLVTAFMAVICGVFIFWPYIINYFV